MTTKARPAEHALTNWHIKRATTAWAFFAFLGVLATCCNCFGDIEVNPQYQANEKITIKVVPTGVPAGALLRGSFQVSDAQTEMVVAPNVAELRTAASNLRAAAAKLLELAATLVAPEQAEQKKALEDQAKTVTDSATEVERALASESYNVWAGTGTHEVTASGIWVLTDTGTLGGKLLDFGMYDYSKSFEVIGGVTPPPPDPANPYKPAPQYQAAVEPVRVLSLVKADSHALATLYSSIASQVRAGSFKNLGEIRAELVTKGKSLNLSGKYAGLAPAVDKYLSTTVGLDQVAPAATVGDAFETLAWAVYEAGKV